MDPKRTSQTFARVTLGIAVAALVMLLLPTASASGEPWTCRKENVHMLEMTPSQRYMASHGSSNDAIRLWGAAERGPQAPIGWQAAHGLGEVAGKGIEARANHMRVGQQMPWGTGFYSSGR